jgi:DGQHR domain-containing protein
MDMQKISVIVPENPFTPKEFEDKKICLCALDVEDLIKWWPGKPHNPHIYAEKVKSIQRSLDWKRVAQIAAYLLQEEIIDVPQKLDKYFKKIYEPKKYEPGREWPPRVNKVIGYEPSYYRVFSNILVHINGAKLKPKKIKREVGAADLIFDTNDPKLNFSVIDGQHRINGAYFAIKLQQEKDPKAKWELPTQIFLDLDQRDAPPRIQAQVFIDVNFYQKKVDRSLVADLFPTARGSRDSFSNKERAQDIGRKLMLEIGPLVGMIQIPGIKYGYKDVITLATLNSAIEDILDLLKNNNVIGLNEQTEFIAQCLNSWFQASGRFESSIENKKKELDPSNVAYQGRILVSILTLFPAMILHLNKKEIPLISEKAGNELTRFLANIVSNAGLLDNGIFIDKKKFKERGFLGSGGTARLRDILWTATNKKILKNMKIENISKIAERNRETVYKSLLHGR